MSTKLIINGWIAPDGEIFECDVMHHMESAYNITIDKKIILPEDNISYRDMIHKYKFIKFFNFNEPKSEDEIIFVLSASVSLPNIEPTQKQIMAMAKLKKQLLKK